jgi:predicted phage tail protein
VTTANRRRVKVKLLGELGRKFGRSYEFMALSPKEVLSALSNQLDGFRDYLRGAHENGVFFKLVTADPEGIDYNECMMPCDTLVIAPVITGAGGSGMSIGKILLGAVLIGLAFIPGIGTATSTAIAAGAGRFYVNWNSPVRHWRQFIVRWHRGTFNAYAQAAQGNGTKLFV